MCDCCASGRDCGERGCDAPLARQERFGLRVQLSQTTADASARPQVRVCARSADGGASERCTGGANFEISVEELLTNGLEMAIELPVDSETGVFRRPIVLRENVRIQPPTGASLCRGLAFELPDLPIEKPALFLEPRGAPPAADCGAR